MDPSATDGEAQIDAWLTACEQQIAASGCDATRPRAWCRKCERSPRNYGPSIRHDKQQERRVCRK